MNRYSIVWKQNPDFLTRFLGFGSFLGRFFFSIVGAIFGGFLAPISMIRGVLFALLHVAVSHSFSTY